MSKIKEFKNLTEQIEILKMKGLTFTDEEKAKEILFRENYFFITGYRYIFLKSLKDKTYIEGVTFDELYVLFLFDRAFRNIIFKNIVIVENNIKSIISYILSKKYGHREKDYLKASNFTQDSKKTRQVDDIIKKMKRQIRVNGNQHSATVHYLNNYGYIPLWVLVKVLSFGLVSELFTILKPEDQYTLAEYYNLDLENLITYLSVLANYRNLCAHEDIVYDNRTDRYILDTIYHRILNIPLMDGEYIYGKNDLFAVIIILKMLLLEKEYQIMISEISYEIDLLEGKLKSVPIEKVLDKMGFPNNWRIIKDID